MVAEGETLNTGRFEYVEISAKIGRYSFGRGCRPVLEDAILLMPPRGYPTIYPPGTAEKLSVFEYRESRKELLFHPFDARYEGDPRPYDFLKLADDVRERIAAKQCNHVLNAVA